MSRDSAKLILASASPRRRELMKLLGLPFGVTEANVDEIPGPSEGPAAVAARLSQEKGEAAVRALASSARPLSTTAVITCDTIVALGAEMLGKPATAEEATAMLRRLRARDHAVYSAITLHDAASGRTRTDVARTDITMRGYTDAEIATYVESGDPFDKAGAYAIQHAGFDPVSQCRGCYASVMGLPLCHLFRRLHDWGFAPLDGLPVRCQAHTGRFCSVFPDILRREE
jgi:MAF protein